MSQSPVLTKLKGNIFTVSLNRPDTLNAINGALVSSLCDALHSANENETIKVIILRGEGRAFCAGAELEGGNLGVGADEHSARTEIERLQDITRALLYSKKIVIGVIQGWAVGAGLEWAINCDFPIWAESAKGFFPEAKWGLSVTGAVTTLLPALVGPMKARELILLGEKHSADEFYKMGIAWKVVPDKQLMDEVATLAEKLSDLPARSLEDLKRGINLGSFGSIDQALAYETKIGVAANMDPETLKRVNQFSSN